ncbi:hypothetical protein LPW11_11920 [Geomonas sp. RF6]|uniref:hypothetical protein n=1 Tax=Geomonas sp. RF6 TaxID=2897342 RepID=UPI001E435247|nr:hypothetical protein [Geomonas sp. RF6]UFS68617.1 hypothetical protein LPW11_11920 [Geomonas sp. RF6]
MSDEFRDRELSAIVEIQVRAANLRVAKVKAEKEFIELQGKEVTPEEKAAIEKKHRMILYQLELEGAEIERDFVEKYRSKIAGLSVRYPGLSIDGVSGCPFCTTCITSCLQCVTNCTACVACSNDVF